MTHKITDYYVTRKASVPVPVIRDLLLATHRTATYACVMEPHRDCMITFLRLIGPLMDELGIQLRLGIDNQIVIRARGGRGEIRRGMMRV